MSRKVITLLTDFGVQDYFVASMKGVILTINPEAVIVDITHDIPPQDVFKAALTLWACYKYFPPGAIHIVVVDPGVGTERKPLIIQTRNYFFVGPDNGVLSVAAEDDGVVRVFEIDVSKLRGRERVSYTFHGRDIFAPAAAYLSLGVPPEEIGKPIDNYVRLRLEKPKRISDRTFECQIVYIDRFGNVYTSVREEHLRELGQISKVKVELPDGRMVEMPFCKSYGYVQPGREVALINSEGFLELAVNFGNFSEKYGVKVLDKVIIHLE